MALTFRTGSGGKGSALTIEELDNNFRYFTGSHSITGSLDIDGNITASGNISASGTVFTKFIRLPEVGAFSAAQGSIYFGVGPDDINGFIYGETGTNLTLGFDTVDTVQINDIGINVAGQITASGNISASGDIIGQTGSFVGGLVLTSPNGTQYAFTTNNDGHLSLTGSVI